MGAKGALKSVDLFLDLVDLNGKVLLVFLDFCDVHLNIGSVRLQHVDIGSDRDSVTLKLGQTSLESAGLSLVTSVGALKSIKL